MQNSTNNATLTVSQQQWTVAICERLVHKRIDSIYTSKYFQTQLTKLPLATAIHEIIVIFNIESTAVFANQVKNPRKNVFCCCTPYK